MRSGVYVIFINPRVISICVLCMEGARECLVIKLNNTPLLKKAEFTVLSSEPSDLSETFSR
jgi:hypothetical protein